jgi:DNA-binding MarR family transcriptional regulator
MNAENEQLIEEIVGTIRKFVRAVSIDTFQMSRKHGLTGPQGAILRALVKWGSLSSASLSRTLYVTPSNITGIIDRLEKKGLVERVRKEEDRRVALITLTKEGTKISKKIPDPIETKLISELADMEPEHVRILALVMNQLLNLIDAQGISGEFLGLHMESVPEYNNKEQ